MKRWHRIALSTAAGMVIGFFIFSEIVAWNARWHAEFQAGMQAARASDEARYQTWLADCVQHRPRYECEIIWRSGRL